jgi:hypothetical protein
MNTLKNGFVPERTARGRQAPVIDSYRLNKQGGVYQTTVGMYKYGVKCGADIEIRKQTLYIYFQMTVFSTEPIV